MAAPDLVALMPRLRQAVARVPTRMLRGRIEQVSGTLVKARISGVRVGELCLLRDPGGDAIEAEVVGLSEGCAFLTPLGDVSGLSSLAEVEPSGRRLSVGVGIGLLGRVLDGLGRPLDNGSGPFSPEDFVPLEAAPPPPLDRPLVSRLLPFGTRAIDGLLACAEGQRIGVFGPAGAGKSTLIARLVKGAEADVFVIALVGERGREVAEFLEHTLGPEARKRAVVVASTSDRPAVERVKAALVATSIAEYFRDRGQRVVLLVDSLTRLARGLREIGLAAGEPPTRRGYPPSVFAALPRLLERAASTSAGSITAFYTVLVEGELAADPVAEEVKSILDGHFVLSPKLAEANHYPAIDVLASRSRVMGQVATPAHKQSAARIRQLLARYDEVELLVRVGEYQAGSDKLADEAIRKVEAIRTFLQEPGDAVTPFAHTLRRLGELAGQ